MKIVRSLLSALAALTLLLALTALAESAGALPGQPMPDFTVTTIDGSTFTLSEVLREKKAVLVNLWATWCGPCEREFPYLEEAYEQYADQVAVIALSTEPNDTPEVLAQYVEAHGMTFPVGSDSETQLARTFVTEGIPTTILVDRFGNIALVEVGSQPSADPFLNAFEQLSSDDYTETVVMDGFPSAKPPRPSGDESRLAGALSLPLQAADSQDAYAWPFEPVEAEGRSIIAASNSGKASTTAEVLVTAEAQEGDALAFEYRISCEKLFDRASVLVNGQVVKRFSGEADWTAYAVPLEAGNNEIAFRYEKDEMIDEGDDTLQLASLRLLSGQEALDALDAVPAYPYAEETALTLISEGAREIVFEPGEAGSIDDAFGTPCRCYIVNDDEAEFTASVGPEVLADDIVFSSNYGENGLWWDAWEILEGPFRTPLDTMESTHYSYTGVFDMLTEENRVLHYYLLFPDEANADILEEMLLADGLTTGYRYADGGIRGAAQTAAAEPASAESEAAAADGDEPTWTVKFTGPEGEPVPGCIVNFCTDESCTPVAADENGVAAFSGEPYAYHLQVIYVPEGYAFDTAQEFYAEENGGEMEISVDRG